MTWQLVYTLPIWLLGAVVVVAAGCGAMLIEVVTRRFLSAEFRRRHNDVTGAMFSIIGVTYAVLLAFVATLAWDGYNRAKSASYAEAEAALDVFTASVGLPEPDRSALRGSLAAYVRAVVDIELPAQAVGRTIPASVTELARIDRAAFAPQLRSGADGDVRGILMQAVTRLADARQDRLVSAESSVPSVVWIVTILGGALTVAFSSFLGSEPSVASRHGGVAGDVRRAHSCNDRGPQQSVPG